MSFDPAHFYSRTRDARKIIVVDLGFLGDTVHLIPSLWELKRGYPKAALHVLTSTVGAEVLQLVPCVERAWAIEMNREQRTFGQQWQVVRDLRREGFDLAFNLSGADRTIFFTALTGAPWRVAHPGGRWHFWNRLLVPTWTARQDVNRPVFEQRRQVLVACGMELAPARFDLQPDQRWSDWASSLIAAETIHLSINASKPTKECTVEFNVEMLRGIWKLLPRATVLSTGSQQERERGRLLSLRKAVDDPRLRIWPDKLSIPQLAALLKRCCLHIGPDSGVLHLAVALEVPSLSFFRDQGVPRPFMPVGSRHRIISVPCRCPDNQEAPCERLARAECLAEMDPTNISRLVAEQIASSARTH